jgi:translation initiation factor 1
VSSDSNSRLVYSTGGEIVDAKPQKQRQQTATAKAPDTGGVRLRLDRRSSGRVVTVVSGLAKDAETLLKELKAACGTGGTLKDGLLELQGDHRDKVEVALGARGIKSKRAGG